MNLFKEQVSKNEPYKTFSNGSSIDVKREDLLHREVSGNKLRKLKYNLMYALENDHHTVLTYGGAFSNHIAATAAAGHLCGLNTIGIIRGAELGEHIGKTLINNTTLAMAHKYGMKFKFISRADYKLKDEPAAIEKLRSDYDRFYRIPEGGTNQLAINGTQEILTPVDKTKYDIIAVAGGTGGTAAGIINSTGAYQQVYVYSALKGDFLNEEIRKYSSRSNYTVISEDTFGGYARHKPALIDYMNQVYEATSLKLDPIYTAKMMYRLEQMIETRVITAKVRILAIHTGGLQAITGYNRLLNNKGKNTIQYEY